MKLVTERFLTFYLDSYLCAFKVADIKEVIRPDDEFTTSDTKAQVRDEKLPFCDLRQHLGLARPLTANARLIVLKIDLKLQAMLVDRIDTVVDLYADQWETVTTKDAWPVATNSIFVGIATSKGQSVLLLDPLKLLEKSQSQSIAS